MTETQWLNSTNLFEMIHHLENKHESRQGSNSDDWRRPHAMQRKMHLFAAACLWQMKPQMNHYGVTQLIANLERCAHGLFDPREWQQALRIHLEFSTAKNAYPPVDAVISNNFFCAAEQIATFGVHRGVFGFAEAILLFRDLIGNPFRALLPAATACIRCSGRGWYRDGHDYNRVREVCEQCNGQRLKPAVIPWRTKEVLRYAAAAYQNRQEDGSLNPATLQNLVLAMERGGCAGQEVVEEKQEFHWCGVCKGSGRDLSTLRHPEDCTACFTCGGTGSYYTPIRIVRTVPHPILEHLRGGKHHRGCCVIDAILDQE